MTKENFSNRQLIYNLYGLAWEQLQNTVTDWSNYELFRKSVNKLDDVLKAVYQISVLNQQVMNGGFIQYFDNSYGMLGYETVRTLRTIQAYHSADLLEQALKIVNLQHLNESEFSKHIMNNLIDDSLGDELDKLDAKYYELGELEDLEQLLADWIKTKPNN